MKAKRQDISTAAESKSPEHTAQTPFFARKLDPESLRVIRAGNESDVLEERRDKLNNG